MARPLYVVVEKILTGGEAAASARAPQLRIRERRQRHIRRPRAAERLDAIYRAFTGRNSSFKEMMNGNKKMIMPDLPRERDPHAGPSAQAARHGRSRYRDFTLGGLTFTLASS